MQMYIEINGIENNVGVLNTWLVSGNSENALDLVFLSEGYTDREKDKFLNDVKRFKKEGFEEGGLYFNYSPFFNLHSVFTPSKLSGVGTNGSPKDTAYHLYRDSGKLRSILPVDDLSYPKALRLCRKHAPACDIAVILVNDPFYGGLGDEVAILSASKSTGSIAFRHELGHILADIGEEYDGGDDYSGANFAKTNRLCKENEKPEKKVLFDGVERIEWPCVSWGKWLSKPLKSGENKITPQPIRMVYMEHPWASFDKDDDELHELIWKNKFHSKGKPSFLNLEFSASGISGSGKIKLFVDEHEIGALDLPKDNDRHFFEFHTKNNVDFMYSEEDSEHEIVIAIESTVKGNIGSAFPKHPPPMLCHIGIWEYFEPFDSKEGFIGAFPVYQKAGGEIIGYRPTDNSCLMREMQSKKLCPICREAIWKQLFAKTQILESIQYTVVSNDVTISLKTLPFSIMRRLENVNAHDSLQNEEFQIRWERCNDVSNNVRRKAWQQNANMFSIDTKVKTAIGCWKVYLQLISDEVRNGRMLLGAKFNIPANMTSNAVKFAIIPADDSLNLLESKKDKKIGDMPGKEEERDELNLKKRKDMARTKQPFSNIEMHSNIEQKSSKKDKHDVSILKQEKVIAVQSKKSNFGIYLVYKVDFCVVATILIFYLVGGSKIRSLIRRNNIVLIFLFVLVHVSLIAFYQYEIENQPYQSSVLVQNVKNNQNQQHISNKKKIEIQRLPTKKVVNAVQKHESKQLQGDKKDIQDQKEEKVPTSNKLNDMINTNTINLAKTIRREKCKSAHYGPEKLVDEDGYICPLVLADFTNGCCPRQTSSLLLKKKAISKRYQCNNCHKKMQCCKEYETCISCCIGKLEEEKEQNGNNDKSTIKNAKDNMDKTKPIELVYDGIKIFKPPQCYDENPFIKCQCRCKTHSQLSRHENSYRTPWHFCYHETPPSRPPYELIIANREESCVSACHRHQGMICEDHDLVAINNCAYLKKTFSCKSCNGNRGSDQPAFNPKEKSCLFNNNLQYISCSGQHKDTKRLCPCRKPW